MPSRPMCTTVGCTDPTHYGCTLRAKGMQVSPKLTPTRSTNPDPTPVQGDATKAQIMYDERPGGTKMPILNWDGSVVRRKQYDDQKSTIESNMRRIRAQQGAAHG